jgi:hypothetical protein
MTVKWAGEKLCRSRHRRRRPRPRRGDLGFTVVLAMAGFYQGLVDDATSLLDRMNADLGK